MSVSNVAVAQMADELEFYNEIAVLIEDGQLDEELRKASNYFLLAGGAIVAYGFYKLIRNQNKFAEYSNRISSIESEIATLNSDIYTKKQEILQLVGY